MTDGGGDLLRFNRPSLVRTPQNFIRARDFALSRRPRNADIQPLRGWLFSSSSPACTLKKRHTVRPALSLSLSLFLSLVAFHLDSHIVHTSAIASLFAPCANCCILHACGSYPSLILFLSRFYLLLPASFAYRLNFLTFRLLCLLQHFR